MSQAEDDAREMAIRRQAARDHRYRESAAVLLAQTARDVVSPAPAPIPGGREFMVSAVGVGWHLYTPGRWWAGEDPEMGPGEAGTVVEVVHDRHEDLETGEVVELTKFRCLAPWRLTRPYSVIHAHEVDTRQLAGIDRRSTAGCIRWLVRPVALGDGLLSVKEHEAITDAWRMATVL